MQTEISTGAAALMPENAEEKELLHALKTDLNDSGRYSVRLSYDGADYEELEGADVGNPVLLISQGQNGCSGCGCGGMDRSQIIDTVTEIALGILAILGVWWLMDELGY